MKLEQTFEKAYNNQNLEIILELADENLDDGKKRFNHLSNLLCHKSYKSSNLIPDIEMVEWIKTVFSGVPEQSLAINYNSKILTININYLHGQLNSYYYKNNRHNLTMSYSQNNNIVFDKPIELKNVEIISNQLKKLLALHNVKAKTLANDSLKLITIYKMFYNEYPDLSLTETKRNFQNMVSILEQFGINTFIDGIKIVTDYGLCKMESARLDSWLYKICSFYKDDLTTRENLVDIKEQRKIKAISNYLFNNLKVIPEEKTEFLDELAVMIYLEKEWYTQYMRYREGNDLNFPKIIRDLKRVARKSK